VRQQAGYTYVVLLIATVTVMASAAITARVSSQLQQRALEQELLFRGEQFRQAIQSYYMTGLPRRLPRRLEDMLEDPRFVKVRHLRKIWSDPMTKDSTDWTILRDGTGGIIGVASRDTRKPIKTKGFSKHLQHFEEAQSYQDWTFVFKPEEMEVRRPTTRRFFP